MTSHRFKFLTYFCFVAYFPFVAVAQDEFNYKSTGLVLMVPASQASLAETNKESNRVINLPGREYKSSAGWWMLACETTCNVARTRLSASPQEFSLHNGMMKLPGQRLQWSNLLPGDTLLFFKTTTKSLKFVAGPVKTYQQESAGKMGVEFHLPQGVRAQIIPVLVLPDINARQSSGLPTLELRIGNRRQTLINGDFSPADLVSNPVTYVSWAGDLDRDGKLDLLVNTNPSNSCSSNIVLFLSSLAKQGELVGEAGRFDSLPNEDEGC